MFIGMNLRTHLGHKDEMHEETEHTDNKNEDLSPHRSTEPSWKHIDGRSDEALHCHKLKEKIFVYFTLYI